VTDQLISVLSAHTNLLLFPQCIIGKGGAKINEIRRLSGSKISIAKTPHDESGERMFTIIGSPEANEKALFLLYNQLGKFSVSLLDLEQIP
jgi:hypothetical protein